MSIDQGLIDWIGEALAPLGIVTQRRMMGGATLYLDGTVFAIISSGSELWFKADAVSDAIWDKADCPRFTYEMGEGRTGTMNYRRAPEDVYDDADAMRHWARIAVEAGTRGPRKKGK
jgi:DNA transformation protein